MTDEAMGRPNVVQERSYEFAVAIVRLSRSLNQQQEFVLARQVLRCGTSIGANVEEAQAAQSRADFVSKMSIARKEARECHYWLRLLCDAEVLPAAAVDPLGAEASELVRLLTSIIKSAQESLPRQDRNAR